MKNLIFERPLQKKGFSLIEIICAMVIVAILTSYAYQSYLVFRNRARDKTTITHLNSLATAILAYKADQMIYPPNPVTPAACAYSADPAIQQAGCLDSPFLNFKIEGLKMPHPWRKDEMTEIPLTVRYFNYSSRDMFVLQVHLVSDIGNPCEFTTGSWCDRTVYPRTYCHCVGGTP